MVLRKARGGLLIPKLASRGRKFFRGPFGLRGPQG
jgi:hypothetical protein